MAAMQKDWKYLARLLLFIPAGYLANKTVLVGSLLIQMFFSWRNPPSEFGESFLEGGLLYFAFGTENGRNVALLIWTFLSYACASVAMIFASLKTYPSAGKKLFDTITISLIFIFGIMLVMNIMFLWEQNIKYYVFITGVVGHFFGAVGLRYALRNLEFGE